ncbi:MAG: GNAT family N-acetyltransferase [Candidatus Limnocylindrales bacterium]
MDTAGLTLLAACNGAARHAAAFEAVGAVSTQDDDAWWATEPGPPIYHDWISLREAAERDGGAARLQVLFDARGGTVSVLDPWTRLELAGAGFTIDQPQHWYAREPGPTDVATPPDLKLRRVTDRAGLADFERTMALGFGGAAPTSGALLGGSLVDDARFRFWLGWWRGEAVVTATAVVAAGVLGVYDVATLPHARGHGFASAATSAALSTAPGMTAVLDAEPAAATLYQRLGFQEFAVFRTWWRPTTEARA